ncbi:hypothetical protein [Nocardia macrotermitis]|uniref:Uncharacterized protein n=1 Tax=Nocardia macrotermitis TaxID=2585198 RepID=A0A7K0DFN9_9NOCA|nr:hypothetical protein [Nocardia macrotermitis]MQY24122.1 hypothetical protein [Nocardia macrotermitis]
MLARVIGRWLDRGRTDPLPPPAQVPAPEKPPWYRDPVYLAPIATVITGIITATLALLPQYFPHTTPKPPLARYVDPQACMTTTWPQPAADVLSHVHAGKNLAGYAKLRAQPCWRAVDLTETAQFTPGTGIAVVCWVDADYTYDTSRVPRYDWYLVADPARAGSTIGWTQAWPYAAPDRAAAQCAQPHLDQPRSWWAQPILTIVAGILTFVSAVVAFLAIRRRRHSTSHIK